MAENLVALGRLCTLADGQWGQVSLAQLTGQVADDLIEGWQRLGIAELVIDGVIRVRAGGRHPFPRLYAAWLRLDVRPAWDRPITAGVVSHRSAAHLYRAANVLSARAEFTATARAARSDVIVHIAELRERDRVIVNGLPVTSPARTLVDLSAGAGLDGADLGRLAQALIGQGWTSADQLGADLTDAFAHRGSARDGTEWLHMALDASAAA